MLTLDKMRENMAKVKAAEKERRNEPPLGSELNPYIVALHIAKLHGNGEGNPFCFMGTWYICPPLLTVPASKIDIGEAQ